jgi:hypothetical protein
MTVVAIVVVVYLVYQAALPTPIPGIPYKTISARRLLGDLPDMLKYTARTRETVSYFASHCVELNSPITQIFIRPIFSKPWVIITDSREYVHAINRGVFAQPLTLRAEHRTS